MILGEARIHKYTHTNNKLSILNIKYYKLSSNFDTWSFVVEIKYRCGSDTLDDTKVTPCPKMSPSKVFISYGVS
jgi:hypothetical protein